jgi:hypothetical protein
MPFAFPSESVFAFAGILTLDVRVANGLLHGAVNSRRGGVRMPGKVCGLGTP